MSDLACRVLRWLRSSERHPPKAQQLFEVRLAVLHLVRQR